MKYENVTVDSLEFPKKNSYQRGSFQYIRMEFCSGGDLEEVVRRAGQLDVSTVKSILFQIFFAFYAGREKLCLRHFDVKLLNFFVSNGSCLLSNSQKEEYDRMTSNNNDESNSYYNTGDNVKMRVGFGDHVFALSLQTSSLSVVKLADFGTSAVGAAGLGDSVSAQQVISDKNYYHFYHHDRYFYSYYYSHIRSIIIIITISRLFHCSISLILYSQIYQYFYQIEFSIFSPHFIRKQLHNKFID